MGMMLSMKTVYTRHGYGFSRAVMNGGADRAIDDIRQLAVIIGLPGRNQGLSSFIEGG
jgi:hypothetical protein